ncbi:hypothetical protein ES703_69457 [subsurface metagenome]
MKVGTRERIDIMYEIMTNIREYANTQRASKTRIMGMCNCNWVLFTELLDTLVDHEYVEWYHLRGKRRLLRLTESGSKYVSVLGEISYLVYNSRKRLRTPSVISRGKQLDIRAQYLEAQK